MLGKPKYKVGDIVKFELGKGVKEGIVFVVDRYGTFEYTEDVSYDFINKDENIVYKHFPEKYVIEKIGEISEEDTYKLLL